MKKPLLFISLFFLIGCGDGGKFYHAVIVDKAYVPASNGYTSSGKTVISFDTYKLTFKFDDGTILVSDVNAKTFYAFEKGQSVHVRFSWYGVTEIRSDTADLPQPGPAPSADIPDLSSTDFSIGDQTKKNGRQSKKLHFPEIEKRDEVFNENEFSRAQQDLFRAARATDFNSWHSS